MDLLPRQYVARPGESRLSGDMPKHPTMPKPNLLILFPQNFLSVMSTTAYSLTS